ncbi:radical SAM protein [Prosthecochloris sp.]|uniref:radical SAM/SPASM domain-containing protein n=1 Tax=Prosthecochloris sp. TaxID=290513 RepID=UPI0025805E66|nr:radical SAM protein [Prosthecochloris sp.]
MPTWSKYSTLFHSERFGYFLYSTMSNCLIQVDEPHYHFLQQLEMEPSVANNGFDTSFISLLKAKHILVEPGENEKLLMLKQYKKNCNCYGRGDLSLTICPTLACNFDCSYCFEHSQHDKTVMSDETIENLMVFIREKAESGKTSIIWYGGEPTLAFDIVNTITRKILASGVKLENAQLVSNGFLLNNKHLDALDDLKITNIQVTLDGPQEIHDTRRKLLNGKPTYERIISNIDRLMGSSYTGSCDIRVNIDKTNMNAFAPFRNQILKRYEGEKVSVHASKLKTPEPWGLSQSEWTDYCIRLYYEHDITTKSIFYPHSNETGLCVAHYTNMYVCGPYGELYKCWEDVGMPEMTIGNVNQKKTAENPHIQAMYTITTDTYMYEECRECSLLPVCSEICPKTWLEVRKDNSNSIEESCTHYKKHLSQCLEVFYDIYLTSETSKKLLNKPVMPLENRGFRIIANSTGSTPHQSK